MKILVDNKIPYIQEAIRLIPAEIQYLSASEFTPENVRDADILIIRTRTKCNASLLEGSRVKFIATATIGFDHIDTAYCADKNILWQNAPGCNSNSVRQYIQSILILLAREYFGELSGKTMGVVGVGHVGSKVASLAESYGLRVLLNDPVREQQESDFKSIPLDVLAKEADIISFHVPLVRGGNWPTYHLANPHFFSLLAKRPIIINTSRGEVINQVALKKSLSDGTIRQAVIDVWENEPTIDTELLEMVRIATPHIAGYSADGKAKATEMALQAVFDYLGIDSKAEITPPAPENLVIHADTLEDAYLSIYNPEVDSNLLKTGSASFEALRSNYRLRRESSAFDIRTE